MDRASKCGSGTVEKLTTSLRAFLRYLAVEGRCRAGLADVVPGYAHWRLADLPRYLAAEQVNRLITACDGEGVAHRRNRAIVLLLARVGLRAGDVAQLRLDDIEWETGSLRVSGKSRYRCVCRFRKTSEMRSPPTWRAALRPAQVITCSCAISRHFDRSGKVAASRRW
jgi:site-specific recombinase XerC